MNDAITALNAYAGALLLVFNLGMLALMGVLIWRSVVQRRERHTQLDRSPSSSTARWPGFRKSIPASPPRPTKPRNASTN